MLDRPRAATSAAFASQGLLFAVLLTHLPAFKDRYEIDDAVVTLVIVGGTVIAGGGSALAAVAAGWWGSGATLRVALCAEVVMAGLIAVAPGFAVFCTAFALYGIALGVVDATTNMQAVAAEHRLGRSVLTSFHAAWSVAAITGALWTALSEQVGIPVVSSIVAAAAAVAGLTALTWRWFARAEPDSVGDERPGADAEVGVAPAVRLGLPFALIGLAMACFYVVDSGTASWSAIYLNDIIGASTGVAALGYAGYQATAVVARLAGDHGVRRWGATAIVRVGAALGIAGLALVVVAHDPWTVIAGFTLAGLGLPVVAPLCFAAVGKLAPGAADGAIARLNLFNYVGALAGGALVGAIGAAGGLRLGFVVTLFAALAVLVLAPSFEGRRRVPATSAVSRT